MSYVRSKRARQGMGADSSFAALLSRGNMMTIATATPSPTITIAPGDDPSDPCCRYLPDQTAVINCVAPFPPGTCGTIACKNADGTFTKIAKCGPPSSKISVRNPPTIKATSTTRPALTSKMSDVQNPPPTLVTSDPVYVTCWDGSKAMSLDVCPVECWDGSVAPTLANCPPMIRPPIVSPPKTTSGQSKPDPRLQPSPQPLPPPPPPTVTYTPDPGIVYVSPAAPAASSKPPWLLIGGGLLAAYLIFKD